MQYRYIDMETYKRKRHFEYFSGLAYPYVGITVHVDITALSDVIRAKKLPFFLTVCYCVSEAANGVPEFRQRIVNHQIIEYEHCRTSHTVALSDGTYCYCDLSSTAPFADYLADAVQMQEEAKQNNHVGEGGEELDKIFISSLPWISYTALVNPVPMPADSHPRITWGKAFRQEEKMLLPVSVLCHHALVDGLHIARFFSLLDEQMQRVANAMQ